jgi:hypothetical protein
LESKQLERVMSRWFEMHELEKRQLFAGLFPPGVVTNPGPPGVAGAVTVPHSLLHGEYNGSYAFGGTSQSASIQLIFNHKTHGRVAHGTAIIQTPDGFLAVSFIGHITKKHRLQLTLAATGFNGTLTAHISHTGGLLKGSFQFRGVINGIGTFSAGKP